MQGDFSVLHFDPRENDHGVALPANGVLRNVNGVLHQQGRIMRDADLTEGELIELGWEGQAGRDIIGASVAAVPANEPDGFRIDAAFVSGASVHVVMKPGRTWADGILTRLAGAAAAPTAGVERLATYFGPPIANPAPAPASIDDGIRDAVILELSEEALHGFQYPERLIEPALGGPDTAERAFVNYRFRLLRLTADEDCTTIRDKLKDDPSTKGKLSATLAPTVAIASDCPVVGGGGYTGFEHNLYRIEIADTNGAVRFKWSQWNAGLAGRGRFDATVTPAKVYLDAGRAAIVSSGLAEFYLEALQYDELRGAWNVTYAAMATLNSDHDLELTAPAVFGTLPSTTTSVFFRLWNGIAEVAAFTNTATPVELRDGIRLVFDAPAAGNYRPGDYWTFAVRAGEISNPAVLVDNAPPVGIVYHRVPLAEINWTGRRDTRISGTIEDCRKRFRPLTNQKICCTFLIGDGITSFGDFNSLEEAAAHLPANGGELCLLPGLHRANLILDGQRNITIHGCERRSLVVPRIENRAQPLIRLLDCVGVHIRDLDLLTYDGIAIAIEGRREGSCRDIRIHNTRVIARVNAIRATNAAELVIAHNRLHLLDTVDGLATISIAADDTLIERNTLVMMPFVDRTPDEPDEPDDNPERDPADPCAKPQILYLFPKLVLLYATTVWGFALALLVSKQPYRAIGGIHVRAGSERVRILENTVIGGGGNGITLGGDLDPQAATTDRPPTALTNASDFATRAAAAGAEALVVINVTDNGQFLALVQDEQGRPLADVDVYLESATIAMDRSDAQGMASIKTAPGSYTLDVAPSYRVVRVAEARDEGILVNAVTVAARAAGSLGRGFLHEITVEQNDISMMGLSGIGFALRNGAALSTKATVNPTNNAKAALLGFIDTAILTLALTPLLRATDPVSDLVIAGNRIHHNLRNPFTQAMLEAAELIGRGGVSLAIIESAVVSRNHVYENGPRAIDPVCGIFVGYGNDLEMTDNVLSANGEITEDYERNRKAGLRGGFYIRFAGALTKNFSASTGRKPALRVHDNRVDQPAGRALTAFAFGPVSCANNHFNSEHTGLSGFVDTAFGAVLIVNLGGIQRMLGQLLGRFSDTLATRAARGDISLPGGETMFNDNYVRLGSVSRSITSQAILVLDDLSYATNTASVFRGDLFFANVAIFAETVRATASRLREDASHTLSMFSMARSMNMTTLNQADHCIVAMPQATSNVLPTIDKPNQVLDRAFCDRQFAESSGVRQFLVKVLAANANELGGTLDQDAFTAAEIATLPRQYMATSLAMVNDTQIATTKAYQTEAVRMTAKLGADHPKAVALKAHAEAGVATIRVLANQAEAATIETREAGATTAALGVRLANAKGQGQAGYTIALVRTNGTQLETVGRTDASGFCATAFDEARTAVLAKEGNLLLRVMDAAGKEVLLAKEVVKIKPGADLRLTLTVPVRIVPKSVATDGKIIYTDPTPPRAIRTPLDKLEIDAATRKRLEAGGIHDVEAILEINADKLSQILGDRALAAKLVEMAKRLLDSASRPAPAPAPPPVPRTTPSAPQPSRTSLERLELDAATRGRLEASGIRDAEGVAELSATKLAEVIGNRDAARKLRQFATRIVRTAGATPPKPTRKAANPRRKKPR